MGSRGGGGNPAPTPPDSRFSLLGEFAGNPMIKHDLAPVGDVLVSLGDLGVLLDASSAYASAVIASSKLTTTHKASGATNWFAGTYTGGVLGWTVPRIGVVGIEAHIKYPDAAGLLADELLGIIAKTTGATTSWSYLVHGKDAGGLYTANHHDPNSGDPSPATPLEADLIAGHWMRLLIQPDGRVSSYFFQSADASILPSEPDYTHQRTIYSSFIAESPTVDLGFLSVSNNGSPSEQKMVIGAINLLLPARAT